MKHSALVVCGLLLVGSYLQLASADTKYELGVRADVRLGTGKPANDMPGWALVVRYKLNKPGWWVGAAIDYSPLYDVEIPVTYFGLTTDEAEDAEASSAMISLFAERHYEARVVGMTPFWSFGAGFNTVSVDDLEGSLSNGSPYLVQIDAGSEVVLEGSVGLRYKFSKVWSASASALAQHRITDWTVREIRSNQEQSIKDYTATGFYFGLNYEF